MLAYLARRLILALLTMWAVSVLSFTVIQLPPGDYITSYIAQMSSSGSAVSLEEADALRQQYGLDQPMYIQYTRWMAMVLRGNFGMAMEYGRPVSDVIGDRLALTMVVSLLTSLVLAITVTPALAGWFIRLPEADRARPHAEEGGRRSGALDPRHHLAPAHQRVRLQRPGWGLLREA